MSVPFPLLIAALAFTAGFLIALLPPWLSAIRLYGHQESDTPWGFYCDAWRDVFHRTTWRRLGNVIANRTWSLRQW